ncbi:Flp family type IVb pilin [Nocardioides marinus]|uniref:Pilus assembly protein Flp/PilA n=1 Tax=Nocardioides marinus TaxID=374514 RepID=A0A7Z0C313_9ACTN|nr:Flp family type IVb pilin [Nocardioides marinus]NYI10643.1 pilus assembly protein Flp/PilA [Nocardioides marinus]
MARRPVDRETGASSVEYGLLIAGIAAVIVLVIFLFGEEVAGLFDDTCETVASTTSQTC